MTYSLVSPATLGFDLVRLPHGPDVAGALLTGLAWPAAHLDVLAAARPSTAALAELLADPAWVALGAAPAASGPGTLRFAGAGWDEVTDRGGTAALLAHLERSMLGDAAALDRLVRTDVLPAEHSPEPDRAADASDVVAAAAVAAYEGESLTPAERAAAAAPLAAAVAELGRRGEPLPEPDLGPQSALLQGALAAIAGSDADSRTRWRAAAAAASHSRSAWPAAMHEACWAAHVAGRLRPVAAAQLLAVRAVRDGGFTPSDGARGVWNAVAGCVQAVAVADLLGADALAELTRPWQQATGSPALPSAG